ncbi:hypothetical protein M902_2735 [Bacteriovorax sp. BAL6_X]|nr:hypothetical protein M902_2735 [Bacteriovorax sp. BAL6_X]
MFANTVNETNRNITTTVAPNINFDWAGGKINLEIDTSYVNRNTTNFLLYIYRNFISHTILACVSVIFVFYLIMTVMNKEYGYHFMLIIVSIFIFYIFALCNHWCLSLRRNSTNDGYSVKDLFSKYDFYKNDINKIIYLSGDKKWLLIIKPENRFKKYLYIDDIKIFFNKTGLDITNINSCIESDNVLFLLNNRYEEKKITKTFLKYRDK